MTIHKSLVIKGRLQRARNVLSRWERITQLRAEERWEEDQCIFGLPKVAQIRMKKKKKKKEKDEATDGKAS